jgi:hypothetical protein
MTWVAYGANQTATSSDQVPAATTAPKVRFSLPSQPVHRDYTPRSDSPKSPYPFNDPFAIGSDSDDDLLQDDTPADNDSITGSDLENNWESMPLESTSGESGLVSGLSDAALRIWKVISAKHQLK